MNGTLMERVVGVLVINDLVESYGYEDLLFPSIVC